MSLENVFKELNTHCRNLRETLLELRTTAVEDKPLRGDVVLVDELGDAADELGGWMEEAAAAALEAQQAVRYPIDFERAKRSLVLCHACLNRVSNRFYIHLASYEEIAKLAGLGRERGGEWGAWSRGVKEAIYRCRPHLYDLNESAFGCWQELTDRLGMTSVSVHSTGVGQQISVSEARDENGESPLSSCAARGVAGPETERPPVPRLAGRPHGVPRVDKEKTNVQEL